MREVTEYAVAHEFKACCACARTVGHAAECSAAAILICRCEDFTLFSAQALYLDLHFVFVAVRALHISINRPFPIPQGKIRSQSSKLKLV